MIDASIFTNIKQKLQNDLEANTELKGLIYKLDLLQKKYEKLNYKTTTNGKIEEALISSSNNLCAMRVITVMAVKEFVKYANAAWYDLSGKLISYRIYVICFFTSAIIFFILAPQFFPPILPLLFIVPIFMGIRGLKARSRQGLTLSLMLFPVSLLCGVTGAKVFFKAITTDLVAFTAMQAMQYGLSVAFATMLTYVFTVLSLVSITSSICGIVLGFMHKDLFV